MTPNTIWKEWFSTDEIVKSSTGDRILEYIKEHAMGYPSEIAEQMGLDPRTVNKWLKRLLATNQIKIADMSVPPTAAQNTRMEYFRVKGMRQNHFKNAKWYVATEDRDEGENDAGN